MQTIILDENQTSVISQSHEAVEVRDRVGLLLGHLTPNGVANGNLDDDHWIECWQEWYVATDEPELQVAG